MKEFSVLHPTLYTPATTAPAKSIDLVNGMSKIDGIWRIVLCTEDSIREDQVPDAIENLRVVLAGMDPNGGRAVYVRVRNPEVMAKVLALPHVEKLRGFVIPKADPASFPLYAGQIAGSDFYLMPILESHLMFDRHFRETLRSILMTEGYIEKIECLRIGANDLMGHLGIRRDTAQFTVYDTPVGNLIYEIINEFRGQAGNFAVTAPVFELFQPAHDALLLKEVAQHMMNGLLGQTVIHPRHVRIIRDAYKVSANELTSAQGILSDTAAVTGLFGRMDERATHLKWAERIVERHDLFGDSAVSQTGVSVLQ